MPPACTEVAVATERALRHEGNPFVLQTGEVSSGQQKRTHNDFATSRNVLPFTRGLPEKPKTCSIPSRAQAPSERTSSATSLRRCRLATTHPRSNSEKRSMRNGLTSYSKVRLLKPYRNTKLFLRSLIVSLFKQGGRPVVLSGLFWIAPQRFRGTISSANTPTSLPRGIASGRTIPKRKKPNEQKLHFIAYGINPSTRINGIHCESSATITVASLSPPEPAAEKPNATYCRS